MTEIINIPLEVCRENGKIPFYANETDGGMDVSSPVDMVIPAGATKIVPTGLKAAVPVGWMLLVFPRSGLSVKTGLRIANSPGLIDAGYRDEIGVILHNTAESDYEVKTGDRIAQFVLMKKTTISFTAVDDVTEIGGNRGGGFGSSGR